MLCLASLLPAQALPGTSALRRPVAEALESIVKTISRESTDSAASKAAREAAEKLGRELPEVSSLLRQYGDDLGMVLRNDTRARLFVSLGDDAAQAFIRNGDVAEQVLARVPTAEMAQLLRRATPKDALSIRAMTQRGQISVADSSEWCKVFREKGSAAIEYAMKNPGKVAGAVGAAVLVANNPELISSAAGLLYDGVMFAFNHPVVTILILLALGVGYIWVVNLLAKSPVLIFRWLGKKMGGSLWTRIFGRRKAAR